ncbi:hypothetical protein D9757_003419 [Collybiopsis confluens]|uniref:Homeobox domain-containing protein n=1 Tax=Collybiopsis confluens TaxID=2823264 RepID=A0A8H5HTC1_9AGAR|nr:hypothetical protein D9757_003419 [Collybiopsis confluens]
MASKKRISLTNAQRDVLITMFNCAGGRMSAEDLLQAVKATGLDRKWIMGWASRTRRQKNREKKTILSSIKAEVEESKSVELELPSSVKAEIAVATSLETSDAKMEITEPIIPQPPSFSSAHIPMVSPQAHCNSNSRDGRQPLSNTDPNISDRLSNLLIRPASSNYTDGADNRRWPWSGHSVNGVGPTIDESVFSTNSSRPSASATSLAFPQQVLPAFITPNTVSQSYAQLSERPFVPQNQYFWQFPNQPFYHPRPVQQLSAPAPHNFLPSFQPFASNGACYTNFTSTFPPQQSFTAFNYSDSTACMQSHKWHLTPPRPGRSEFDRLQPMFHNFEPKAHPGTKSTLVDNTGHTHTGHLDSHTTPLKHLSVLKPLLDASGSVERSTSTNKTDTSNVRTTHTLLTPEDQEQIMDRLLDEKLAREDTFQAAMGLVWLNNVGMIQ